MPKQEENMKISQINIKQVRLIIILFSQVMSKIKIIIKKNIPMIEILKEFPLEIMLNFPITIHINNILIIM